DRAEHRGQRSFDAAAHGAALVRGLGIEGQDGAVVLDGTVDVEQRDAAWGTGQPGAAALPLLRRDDTSASERPDDAPDHRGVRAKDRKSTRLNSSHDQISYAVFCLKKKRKT